MAYKVFYISTLIFASLLASCDQKGSEASPRQAETAPLLIPELSSNLTNLISIELRDNHSHLKILSKDGIWSLDSPYETLVSGAKLNRALSQLIQANQGQSVTLSDQDLEPLLLSPPSQVTDAKSGIELILNFDKPEKKLQLILGAYEVGKDSEESYMFGELAVARRYVRFLNEDKVFLTATPLNLFEPHPELWQVNMLPPIHRLQELGVTEQDGFSWTASKTSSYSPISLDAPFESEHASHDLSILFDSFLATGDYDRTLPRSPVSQSNESLTPLYTVKAKDRFGGKYTIKVLGTSYDNNEKTSDDLKTGALLVGKKKDKNQEYRVCRLEIDYPKADLTQKNLISSVSNRDILFIADDFSLIEGISGTLKKQHEE